MSPTRPQAPVSLGFLNSIQVSMLLARARALSPTPSLSPFFRIDFGKNDNFWINLINDFAFLLQHIHTLVLKNISYLFLFFIFFPT